MMNKFLLPLGLPILSLSSFLPHDNADRWALVTESKDISITKDTADEDYYRTTLDNITSRSFFIQRYTSHWCLDNDDHVGIVLNSDSLHNGFDFCRVVPHIESTTYMTSMLILQIIALLLKSGIPILDMSLASLMLIMSISIGSTNDKNQ